MTAALPPEARDKPLEIWWQDEARVGQQGTRDCREFRVCPVMMGKKELPPWPDANRFVGKPDMKRISIDF